MDKTAQEKKLELMMRYGVFGMIDNIMKVWKLKQTLRSPFSSFSRGSPPIRPPTCPPNGLGGKFYPFPPRDGPTTRAGVGKAFECFVF